MSTAIAFRFLAGRYHATPWGANVNEAAVEWPPSPWRVLRALIAVWHRKVDPGEMGEEELERLVLALASQPVRYRLPAAVHAHSRHYMPVRSGRADKPRLIFDAFARVADDDELIMVWPDVFLSEEESDHLTLLLHRMGYLGRAESWVEARLRDQWNGEINCSPIRDDSPAVPDLEMFSLPVPMVPSAYRAWRDEQVTERGLDQPKLRKKEQALKATLPQRLIDALRVSTGDVRAQGWSRHPGLESVRYGRPAGALKGGAPRMADSGSDHGTTAVRLILKGKPLVPKGSALPRIEDAIKIGEVVRAAAMSAADRVTGEEGEIPRVLSGHGMGDDNVHGHAFYLPEDADGDGHIDHILVHADEEFDDVALAALAEIPKIWLDGGSEWGVVFEAYGDREALGEHPYLARSTEWVSVTPYLHPWYRKKSFVAEDQIRKECRIRGLPEPVIEPRESVLIRGRHRRPVHFHRFRRPPHRRARQPDTRGSFWTLTFPEPVSGPLALGFGCHFGLGIFQAVEPTLTQNADGALHDNQEP